MGAQDLFDLERRHFEAAGLDDVNAETTEQAVRFVFQDREIAGPEPISRKRLRGLFRATPILEEDVGAANLEFARTAGHNLDALFVHKPNIDPRQGRPDESWTTVTVERVRQGHPDLRHAVALEQRVTGDLAPPFEDLHR